MRILVISDYLPYPLTGGDRIRIYNLLRRLADRHEVYLAAFESEPAEAVEALAHLREFCVKVETASFIQRSRLSRLFGMLGYALSGKPPELKLLHSDELVKKIQNLTASVDFDIVQIEHSRMGLYLETLPRNHHRKTVLMFHNFTSQQYLRVAQIEKRLTRKVRAWLHAITMRRWEPAYAGRFDLCTTVSEEDQQLLEKANPRTQVEVIPNGVDTEKFNPLPVASTAPALIFVGNMEYPPCVDAVLHFNREILPRIQLDIPDAEFWIVGRKPRPEVIAIDGGSVHVTGLVDDVVPYYQKSTVCVVPLRAGGGTRLKILEAMALGRPIVSTTIGCEGLDVIDGKHLLIADEPEQFAQQTLRLLTDQQLYARLAEQGRQLVMDQYSWDTITDKLMDIYERMIAQDG